jgi:hypothetical protein
MQKPKRISSSGQHDREERDSVYDFLYQDARRVGSFLAQLNPEGHAETVKSTTSTEETGGRESKVSAAGSAVVLKGSAEFSARSGNTNRDGLERTLNPLWTDAIDLLTLLDQGGMIERDLASARIGGIVLVSGTLGVFDASMMKAFWDNPTIRSLIMAAAGASGEASQHQSRSERRRQQKVGGEDAVPIAGAGVALDLLKHFRTRSWHR